MSKYCHFDRNCHRVDCYFNHPNGRVIDQTDSFGISRQKTSPAGKICRHGRACSREGCYFYHPEGRAMDAGSSSLAVVETYDEINDQTQSLADSLTVCFTSTPDPFGVQAAMGSRESWIRWGVTISKSANVSACEPYYIECRC